MERKNEIRHYVDGEKVIVYEPKCFDYDGSPIERINIFRPVLDPNCEKIWESIKRADNLGRSGFENLSGWINSIRISRDYDFGIIKNVTISDRNNDSYISYSGQSNPISLALGFKDLGPIKDKIENLVNQTMKRISRLSPTKTVTKTNKQPNISSFL